MEQPESIHNAFKYWEKCVRDFIAHAEEIQALGAVELGKGTLLFGLKFYEDMCKNADLSLDERAHFVAALRERTDVITSYVLRNRAYTHCDLTRYDCSRPSDD